MTEAGGVANGTPGVATATGDLTSTDVDNPGDLWQPVSALLRGAGGFGSYAVTAAGHWTYTLDNSNPAVQALNVGGTLIDTFTATTVDGTAQLVTITIQGANDAAVITGATSGNVTEAGGVNNATPGTLAATGDLNATDVDNPPDQWTAVATATASAGGYGSYTLTADGVWNYTLDNGNAAVQALNVGDRLTDTFTATTAGGTAQLVTITINGANDAADITGATSGAVTEAGGVANGTPGTQAVSGNLNSADVDNPDDAWDAVATSLRGASGYGSYAVTAAGVWAYTLDNSNAAVQALNLGQTLTDTFTAFTVDGTSQLVTITINGANDAAVITGTAAGAVVEAGGVANGTPGTPAVTGDLNATDVDNAADAWTTVATATASAGGYGSYTLTAAGVWAYTLDNGNATVQALNVGGTLTDSFTVTTVDGTARLVTITINGANDAAVITGATTGSVTEAGGVANGTPGTPAVSGNLNSTDVDNAADAWTEVATATSSAGGHGSYTLTAAGVWAYTLDDSNAAVQALNVGGTLTDTFTATTVDGTARLVTITINGANDAAVITGATSGNVTEAGGVNNATPGTLTATGDLNATDVDNTADAWTAVATATASAGGYGSYTLTAAGVWAYTLDNSNATVQALNIGGTLTDTFTATTVGGTTQLVTITIHGANDAAVITGTATGAVIEAGGVANGTPGIPVAAGNLNATDVDNPPDKWAAVGTATASANGYGLYRLTAAGIWAYALDNSNATVQALNVGGTLTDTFTAFTVDGTSQVVTITIQGTNDAAVIAGTAIGAVTEAGGIANGTPGTPAVTGDLNATDVDNATDAWTAVSAPVASAGGYGSYTLTATGVWTYTLDNGNAAVQALNVGGTLTDTFTATTVDGTARLVTITINGANDAAVITGTASGTVIEASGVANGTPGTPAVSGNLNSTDVDNAADAWTAVATATASAGGYGTYTLTAAGAWAYTLDNSNAAVQALNVGQTLTDTFTARTIDGTSQVVTITINGANDAPVITGPVTGTVVEAGGINNGTTGTPTVTGDLSSADVDNPADGWQAVAAGAASVSGYGSYALTAGGAWTYTLNNGNAAVQALNVGQTLIDTFTATTIDGTSQVVTITINGANDAPVITGPVTGTVVEAGGVGSGIPGNPVATGNLDSTDVDNPNDSWTAVATAIASTGGYGSYTLTAAGVWTYTLDNNNAAVQELGTGDTLPDSFTVTTSDGTSQVVTITIHGTDDAAVISGDLTGTVLEAGGIANGTPGIPTATGNLDAADDDNPPDWTPVGTPAASTSGYGTYTLTAAGDWVYTLDNSNATVQALNVGGTLTDTFTAVTTGGTAQLVTITIDGANDAAVITGPATGAVTEAGGVANGTPGITTATGDLSSTDVDNPADLWQPVSALLRAAGGYGSYTVTASGLWTYTLDDSNAAVQALNVGGTLIDTFTATTVDGTAQLVTITIQGANDAAVITGATSGNVTEAGGVNNATPGTLTATGDLNATDVDNTADAWTAVATATASAGGYGSYTLTAAWVWAYTLDNSNATVQALNVGGTLTDTFTATTVGGTAQLVTITIHGANDAADITGATSGSVTEAGGVANGTPGTPAVSGNLNSTDVDNPPDDWVAVGTATASAGGYGAYRLTAAGIWAYALDNSNATVQALNVGGTLTDTFTATTVDGTSKVVTITIQGTNDAAVIAGTATGAVTEAGGTANGSPGTPAVTGDLSSTDVDNAVDAWTAVATATASAGGYGSYTLTAAGVWTYTLDNSNATVQALNVGGTLTDSFTVTTVDGTARLVTITINGANDAAVITGTATGTVGEAGGVNNGTLGTPIATGNLDSTDVDNPPDGWAPVATPTASANGYGYYALSASGIWIYALNNSNAAVQALNVGRTLTDTFTAFTVGGTAQLVTVTIQGANDAAVISGTAAGTVVEAGGVNNATPGTPAVTGDLNATDVDNAADAWTAVATATASAGGYGSYTLTAAGVWTYTLDNSNATVQALNVGGTLTDSFTVTTVDGTARLVTITINGANDAAVITGTATGEVIEAGGIANGTPGTATVTGNLDAADVDNPPDGWNTVGSPTASANGYGSYTLTAAGVWTYTLDNSNAAVQALNAGGTLTDTFTATTVDGAAQLVTITISGANDAAVITGTSSGSVTEAGGVANGTAGVPTATGDLHAADVDNPPDGWNAVSFPTAGTNGFGTYTLTVAGVWIYRLDDSHPAVQALNIGDTLTDTFTATTADGTQQLVTITIVGANDAAAISGDTSAPVTEAGGVANGTPGIPTATGDLNSADVDNPGDAWMAVATATASTSGYGSYTVTASGLWTYTLDDSNPAVQALNAGGTLTDTFTATTVDGTAQVVTITINGANDAPVITGAVTGAVVEAGGVANGTPGTSPATGDLNAADADNAADAWIAVSAPAASASGYGSYTLTAAGLWTWTLDNSHAAVQALNAGQTLTDTFTVTTVDGTAQLVTVTINGANDAAVIGGITGGSVTEAGKVGSGIPGVPIAAGDLDSTDVDNPPDAWNAVGFPSASASGYGTYTLTAAGVWIYILDNSNPAVQALNVDGTLTDTFTAVTVDGTRQVVTITILGTNDAAVISGDITGTVLEAGGVANGTPGIPATGDLDAADADNPPDWVAVGTPAASTGGYGSYTLTAAGVWTYAVDDNDALVQALNVGDTLTDTFTATTVGSTTQVVTITIEGANDAAVIIDDTATGGAVSEAGGVANGAPGIPTATGDLTSTDVDNDDDLWQTVSTSLRGISGFGTYTLTAAGLWTYTLDNNNPAVQALNAGQTLTDSFTVATIDGTTQLVTITINGTNDVVVITGDITGSVVEAGGVANGTPGTPVATGDLTFTDVDSPSDAWTPVGAPIDSAGGFGTYTLTAAGLWTYTLDDNDDLVQALNVGDTLTDTFTATAADGIAQLVTVTINGANDAAVITGEVVGSVVEAGGVANGTPGTSFVVGNLDAADVDDTPDSWIPIETPTRSAGNYGTFTLDAAGQWVYILDDDNIAVQALNVGGTLTDTFTAVTVDGTQQLVTVTITGADDAPVITGAATGAVTEAGGVANATPGTAVATGDLNSADVDSTADVWTAVGTATASTNGFGSYTMTAAGVWTWTLDDSNAAVQALNVGDTLNDRFAVTTIDGTIQLVTVTINGANDAAVISGDITGNVLEAGGVANGAHGVSIATGHLNATDVDNPDNEWDPVGASLRANSGFGTYTLTAAGVWAYTLDDSNAAVQALNVGGTLTDTFTAVTVDGTAQLVTITIQGANDAAFVTGTATAVVTEAGGVANATPGTPTATGDLSATDVDNPTDVWTAVATALPGDNGFGTYTLTTAGVWSYTLDNNNATVQALNAGDTLTDRFTVTTIDGTAQLVTITINGANDAAVISGAASRSVTEAGGVDNNTPGAPITAGNLDSTDVDNPDDSWNAVTTPRAGDNDYGAYTLTATGVWLYRLHNGNAAVQALNAGDTLIDTFTAITVDGTAQLVTITINGTNDAAVISGTVGGSVTEAGGVANGTPGTSTATGNLDSTDVDNTADAWTAVGTPTASAGGFGSYTLTAAGVWTWTLDNGNATVQALNTGQTLTDTFTVAAIDGTAQLVTITINGSNDAADITGPATGAVTEAGGVANGTPGTPAVGGNLSSTDVDNPDDSWILVVNPISSDNGYGSYTLTAAGVWAYTLDNSNAAVQALNVGGTLTDTFTAFTVDGTAQRVTITINGSNDLAVITGPVAAAVIEAGGVANGASGTPTATGDLNSTDVDNPNDSWTAVGSPTASANGYGSYTLTTAGVWAYTLDNLSAAVQALNVGDTLTDSFTVTTIGGAAQLVTVTIYGADDAAVITGATAGDVVEAGGVGSGIPGVPTTTGNLDTIDVDSPPDNWTPVATPTPGHNGFGAYTLTAAGVWTYTLDNSNLAVQALGTDATLTDTFTAIAVDGTAQLVTVTIHGTDDAAVISGDISGAVLEAGGVANGTPGTPTVTGDLDAADVDNPPDWTPVATPAPGDRGFGSYTLTAAGVWTYTLDNTNATVQALNAGQTLTDTFTARIVGDTTTQLVTITINGANDTAVIGGTASGAVTEAGGVANGAPGIPAVSGDLNSTDVDNTDDLWETVGISLRADSGFSTYTLTAAGVWTYTLDNTNAVVQALNVGQTLTDTFTATTVDGTAQLVTITITGTNDTAVISGATSGSVTEAGGVANATPGTPVATGDLNSADVDNTADAWTAVATATASTNRYGSYTLTAAGVWTYTLDDNNAAVQALNVGQTLTDSFTVTTVDGTAQLVTITINGKNDAAVISGPVSGAVTEAGGVANGTPGVPAAAAGNLDSTDVDTANDLWMSVSSAAASANGFGAYTLTSTGGWNYTLDNSNAAVQALNVGQTLTDSFTATTIDGTAQLVTITINGSNDAAVISGATSGSVTEAGGVANAAPGSPVAIGDLNSADVDNAADAWTAVNTTTASTFGFGTYRLTSAGVWTYTLDNNNATVQALSVGQTLTDSFTANTVDGAFQVVTITIDGANDAATITGDVAGSVVEAGGVNNGTPGTPTATGDLAATDPDNPADAWNEVATPLPTDNHFGTYTLTPTGVWTYTLNNSNSLVQALNVGQTLTDTFTVATIGGTAQLITVTITGANDAAVVTGLVTGTVLEAGGVNNGSLGTRSATGDLNAADVDNPNDAWTAVATPAASVYGTYTLSAAGVWTYTLDNSNAAVQGLRVGQSLTDTFTVTTIDGTARLVTITINGSDDSPVAVADNNAGAPVTESGVNPGNTPFAGNPSAAGNVLANDLDVDSGDTKRVAAVNGEALNVGQSLTGVYGALTVSADGSWSYTLNNADPDTNALAQGEAVTDVFTYTMADADGATSSSSLTVAITGTNDLPDIVIRSGDRATAALTETGAGLTGSGTLTVRDPDLTNTVTASVTAVALTGITGGLTSADVLAMLSVTSGAIAADPGDINNLGWAFNSGAQAFSFLNAGQTLTLAYTVQATDGSASDAQTVTVTINGAGAAPVANGDLILVSDLTTVVIPWGALLANDSDPTASIVSVTSLNGVGLFPIPVSLNTADRTITFNTPIGGDFSGNSFTYTISTASGTSTASVAVSILPINNPFPVSTDLSGQFYDFSYLFTNSGDDVLGAGGATDHFFGGAGNDVYRFTLVGGGDDHIDESILGGAGNDTIQILTFGTTAFTDLNFQRGDGDVEGLPDDLVITYSGNLLTVNDQFDPFPNHRVEQLAFTNGGTYYGYALGTGPYSIDNTSGGNDIVAGTSSNDSLNGGSGGRELLFGNAGNDTLDAGIGDDLLEGGTGNDMLFGGSGNDTYLFGLNDGIDSIIEGGGVDQIVIATHGAELSSLNVLAAVDDLVIDYNGQQVTVIDQLSGNGDRHLGSLTFFGGASYLGYDLGSSKYTVAGSGTDMIRAGDNAGNFIQGASGRDLIFGNGGNDTIIGGGGTDLLVGGAGSDTITGGSGNDVLVGGTGHDFLTGGGAFDRFVFADAGLSNSDVITDYATTDIVDLSPLLDSQFGPTDNFADFARIVQNGSTITVQADLDGSANGGNFVDVAVLNNYGTFGQDLVHVHFGNTTHDLVV